MRGTTRKTCVLTPMVGLIALATFAGGCSSTRVGGVRVRPADAPAISEGGAAGGWGAAMPGDFLASSDDTSASRRDAALNPKPNAPVLASAEWPHAPQPLFERPRRVHLDRDPDSVLQFLRPRNNSR